MTLKPNWRAVTTTIVICVGYGGLLIVAAGYDFNWGRK